MEEKEKDGIKISLNINTPQAIIIAGIIIAIAVYFSGENSGGSSANNYVPPTNNVVPSGNNNLPATGEVNMKPLSSSDHVIGSIKAPIVIVEYSDLECPFCKRFHPTLKQIVEEYKGQVAWVYRHMPLDALHKKARIEAEATECANEQGGNAVFWKYLDRIYEITTSNDGLDSAQLPKIAGELGLNVDKFNLCLSSGKYKNLVEEHLKDAQSAGFSGTPSSVIINTKTGKKTTLVGADTIENVRRAIDSVK